MSESILDKLPLPKLEAYYEAPKKQYWICDPNGVWFQVNGEAVIQRLEALGYNAKPPKGKKFSEADRELERVRMENHIMYAGPVAGHQPGLKQSNGGKYLITRGPKLVTPAEGDWSDIRKLGLRLFGDEQWERVLGWSQNAIRGLYRGGCRRGQILVLAGPPGCGKSFWQNRIITPMLGGRFAKPVQFMTGGTTFNADLIASEHLMLEDEISRTDLKSRNAFGSAIKGFTVNTAQRVHGKGDNGFSVDSSHWMTMSVNDEPENLGILPPLEHSIVDKLMLLWCRVAINDEWPGNKQEIDRLHHAVVDQMPAFIHYLTESHKIRGEIAHERYGVKAFLHQELVDRINGMSPEAELEYLIDVNWSQLAAEKKTLTMSSREIRQHLLENQNLCRQADKVVGYRDACGNLLAKLAEQNPEKFKKPHPSDRPRLWRVIWTNSD